jgi:hypothetical protein
MLQFLHSIVSPSLRELQFCFFSERLILGQIDFCDMDCLYGFVILPLVIHVAVRRPIANEDECCWAEKVVVVAID